jgi:hypothetical protein
MKINIQTAMLLLVLLTGCEKLFVPEPANDPEEILEQLWATFEEEYAPFEERGVDWDCNTTFTDQWSLPLQPKMNCSIFCLTHACLPG